MVRVLDAFGCDVVIVETVGVGQDELEITRTAHSTLVVMAPGMGDEVQAIKAGILETADVFAVNKADREGADRTVRDLQMMLELRHSVAGTAPPPADHDADHRLEGTGVFAPPSAGWEPPIVRTVATRNDGVEELAAAVERHRRHLVDSGELAVRDVARARARFVAVLRERLLAGALRRLDAERSGLDAIAARIAAREADPYALADELAARLGREPG
jgi:LAO/AO transport system kinase